MAHCGLILLLAVCGIVSAQYDVHEGSECKLANGSKGVCVLLYNCEPALKILYSGGRPNTCSYSGFTPVVCCSQPPPEVPETPATEPPSPSPPPIPTPKPSPTAGRISERKCQEYGKSVFRLESTFIPGEKVNRSLCKGHDGVPFILGGTAVKPMEYPHAAIIGYDTKGGKNWLCGGTLISERFVLTAAHCLEDHSKEGVSEAKYVRLGEVNLAVDTESEIQEFNVKSFHMHPDYKSPIKYNDIGLIELDRDAEFDEYVRPACLQTSRDDFEKDSMVVGWGKIDYWQPKQEGGGAWSQKLLKAEIQWSPHDYCKSKYDSLSPYATAKVLPQGISDDTMLCFGDKTGKKDACGGDSGGPLQYQRSSPYCMYTVLGVTSFGNRCGKPDFPSIYTRVSYYVPWIESIVWPNEN
ncbi:venom protease [Anabrus simplex]|uniref:venom protease n=1 Tax=Anabrus simplex TaxID=316456 RepID=UPI0035A27B4D